jgi:hypothetical protein
LYQNSFENAYANFGAAAVVCGGRADYTGNRAVQYGPYACERIAARLHDQYAGHACEPAVWRYKR